MSAFHFYEKEFYLNNPPELLDDIRRNIKWAWQRVFRGWDDRVAWSIDDYLSELVPEWIERLKKTKQGRPVYFMARSYEMVGDVSEDNSDSEYEKLANEWDAVLDDIIIGFRAGYAITQSNYSVYDTFELECKTKNIEWNLDQDSEYHKFYSEFGVSQKIQDEHALLMKKFDHGMKLFHANYFSLWD